MENTRFFNTLLSSLKQRNKISRVRCSRCASNDAKSDKVIDLRFVSIADCRLQIADLGIYDLRLDNLHFRRDLSFGCLVFLIFLLLGSWFLIFLFFGSCFLVLPFRFPVPGSKISSWSASVFRGSCRGTVRDAVTVSVAGIRVYFQQGSCNVLPETRV